MIDTPIDQTPEWKALVAHRDELADVHLRHLFADDPGRAERMTLSAGDPVLDLSKHLVTDETITLLVALAERAGLAERTEAMFSGEVINTTEGREVLHTALRAAREATVEVLGDDGKPDNVVPEIHDVLDRMGPVAERIRSGEWTGHTGQRIRTVVNIGIGGSDLGPLMATRALRHIAHPDIDVRFVSNVDGAHLDAALTGLDPAETLFIVASKTFTTIETITNATSARTWLLAGLGGDEASVAKHFVALSTNAEQVEAFGIDTANMFEFWDWVGGRYSVDSAIGFSLMVAIGAEAFGEFLAGFRTIDEHFRTTPVARNAPAMMALLGVWYRNFWGFPTHAVLPYTQALERFPAYLQQLDMESNGKRITLDGDEVTYDTGAILWGEPGTNGQHAFYQLLHQGTTPVPSDLIGFLEPEPGRSEPAPSTHHHALLFGNLLAQAEALAFGKTAAEVAAEGTAPDLVAHRTFPGNRPSTMILAERLTAGVVGQLIALYEHRVFTQGVVWGVNSFDQWGVELGKVLATRIVDELIGTDAPDPDAHDASTAALIARYRAHS